MGFPGLMGDAGETRSAGISATVDSLPRFLTPAGCTSDLPVTKIIVTMALLGWHLSGCAQCARWAAPERYGLRARR
jgi:hypothetical protein